MTAELTPEAVAEIREDLGAVRDGLSSLQEDLGRMAANTEALGKDPSEELRERTARLTDTDIVYTMYLMRNLIVRQARDGCIPAVGAIHTLTTTMAECVARFVPKAVIERVDRIFNDEAEMDLEHGRFL